MKLKRLFAGTLALTILFAFSLQSCKITLVPKKDPSMIVEVIDGAAATENLYDNMISGSKLAYATNEPQYQYISAKIDSIYARDVQRKHSKLITLQVVKLKRAFENYWNYHKNNGKLTVGECRSFQEYLRAFWKPVKVSELSLK